MFNLLLQFTSKIFFINQGRVMNKIVNFLGKPRTIKNVIKNRKTSWLELFYDLIFAVVFSRLTESLLEHRTLTGFINAILTFFWLIWG